MTYPEFFVAPMRQELTSLGVRELRSAAEVDAVLGRQLEQPGDQQGPTVMVIVNSVCGCAAGKARPGVALALSHQTKPDIVATVFAGADIEATDRARSYFAGYPPSSPSIALMRDGKLLVDARAAQHRESVGRHDCEESDRRVRQVLRAGIGQGVSDSHPPRVCISMWGFFFRLDAGKRGDRSLRTRRSSAPRSLRALHSFVTSPSRSS